MNSENVDSMEMNENEQTPKQARRTSIMFSLIAALAGLLFGLDIGVISGAIQFIQSDFGITDKTIELIVSAMMVGALIGALASGWLSKKLGRKRLLILGAIIF